ncbi:MAG TPA: DUF2339 domain-containing protein, partial [Phycisphaerae bacterium]|nr:DUF2339 domain-containing protein [Phycisphaerae bacterium]
LIAAGVSYAVAVPGFLMNPVLHPMTVGATPVWNGLLYGFGVPLLLAGAALAILHPRIARHVGPLLGRAQDAVAGVQLPSLLRAAGCVLLFILVTLEVRQYFQGAFLDASAMNFFERATYPVAWFMLAGVMLAAGERFRSLSAARAGLAIAAAAVVFAVMVEALLMNPLWQFESVGGAPIFNGLLYAYGVPAAMTGLLAWRLWKHVPRREAEGTLAWAAAVASLCLIFTLVTLEVQQGFRGDHLRLGPGPAGEFTAYSLAWSALGAAFLVAGIFRRSPLLRWASLLMLSLTILKVFLFDMADLRDFERVLSFAGLGLSLMALAFVYQRFVFRKAA